MTAERLANGVLYTPDDPLYQQAVEKHAEHNGEIEFQTGYTWHRVHTSAPDFRWDLRPYRPIGPLCTDVFAQGCPIPPDGWRLLLVGEETVEGDMSLGDFDTDWVSATAWRCNSGHQYPGIAYCRRIEPEPTADEQPQSGYTARITRETVLNAGSPLRDQSATHISIEDESGGEFLRISQDDDSFALDPKEWTTLRAAIDRMVERCKP